MQSRGQFGFTLIDINGWQDTFAIWNNAVVYCSLCEVRGCVDFIYSGGTAFFTSCNIRQMRSTGGVNCAPSTPSTVTYGFVFSGCTINRASGVANNSSTLMRPWGANGETAYVNCSMDSHITAAGWSPWDGRELTCRGGVWQQDAIRRDHRSLATFVVGRAADIDASRAIFQKQRARRLESALVGDFRSSISDVQAD